MRLSLLGLALSSLSSSCASSPFTWGGGETPVAQVEVQAVDGLGLFEDEQQESRVLVASALAARGLSVADPSKVERAWAAAAEGRNPLTGLECGRPLTEWEARKRWGTALGFVASIDSHAWCEEDGGCSLSLDSRAIGDGGVPGFPLVAPLQPGPALRALEVALQHLAPPEAEEGAGGLGLLGGLGGGGAQREDVLHQRAWREDWRYATRDHPGAPFPSLTPQQVDLCLAPGKDRLALRIEFDAAGKVVRCEPEERLDGQAAACACGLFQKAPRAGWLSGARWGVELRISRADQLSADGRLVVSAHSNTYLVERQAPGESHPHFAEAIEDASLEGWWPGSGTQLRRCFGGVFTKPGRLSSRWAVWFDGRGRVTQAIEQKVWPWLPKEASACVVQVLRTATAPCPSRAGLWAKVDVHAEARDPSAPARPLLDAAGARADAGAGP
jgi:hypothetical protein